MNNEDRVQAALVNAIDFYEQGRLEPASQLCMAVLQVDPDESVALHLLGLIAADQGRLDDAAGLLQRATACAPDDPDVWNDLGNVFHLRGEVSNAASAFLQATRINPGFAEAYSNFGYMLLRQRHLAESLAPFRKAIELDPAFSLAYNNLGTALMELKQFDSAAQAFQNAIDVAPHDADAYINLGNCLRQRDCPAEAVETLKRGLQLAPDRPELWLNLSGAQKELGRFDEAVNSCERSIQLRPNYAQAHWNLSLLLLASGDWERGWEEFEWRRKIPHLSPLICPTGVPEWTGQPVAGKTVLVVAEQGLGDTLQFIRYAASLHEQGARVVGVVQPELRGILQGCDHLHSVTTPGEPLSPSDFWSPLLSLPRWLSPGPDAVPGSCPYLEPDPHLVGNWQERLRGIPGFKVGIGWQGNPNHGGDRHRSVALKYFEPIARLEGISLISLQYGYGTEQLGSTAASFTVLDLGPDRDRAHGPFADTAAILQNLDLVISIDTALVHLAGALGVHVWMPIAFISDWRWLRERTDSPWYPKMRLFRQTRGGDWEGVFLQMATELTRIVSHGQKLE